MNTKLSPGLASQYSTDKRKRRNQHRKAARHLLTHGGFFNGFSAPGSTFWHVAQWHLSMARHLGR